MRIVKAQLSDGVITLLRNIFKGHELRYLNGHAEEYLFWLLKYLEDKSASEPEGHFHNEMMKVAWLAHNQIEYGMRLDETPPRLVDE